MQPLKSWALSETLRLEVGVEGNSVVFRLVRLRSGCGVSMFQVDGVEAQGVLDVLREFERSLERENNSAT